VIRISEILERDLKPIPKIKRCVRFDCRKKWLPNDKENCSYCGCNQFKKVMV
jgi:hypothetical protein